MASFQDFDEIQISAVQAMQLVRDALAAMHPQAGEIVVSQVVLERQLRELHRTRCGGFRQTPSLAEIDKELRASGADAWTCLVLDAIRAFTDLRNALAHGDNLDQLGMFIANLADKFERVGPTIDPMTVRYGTVAMSLAAALRVGFGEADADKAAVAG